MRGRLLVLGSLGVTLAIAVVAMMLVPHAPHVASHLAGALASHGFSHGFSHGLGSALALGSVVGSVVNMDVDYYRALNANVVNKRNVYPRSSGQTTGGVSSSMTPYSLGDAGSDPAAPGNVGPPSAAAAATNAAGVFGKPVTWWLVLMLVLGLLWWAAKRWGGGAERMSNIGPTVHNGAVITLTAVIGIVFLKLLTARIPVPGLSQLAAAI